MFDIDLPWWEFIVRGAIVYCALLMLVRVSGKGTVGQFTPFDLLVVMLLSESVSNGESVLIGRDGKIFYDVAKRSRISESDIQQALHEADVELNEARCIFLEADGTITVLEKIET